jgi:hypothetical protein
MNVFVGVTCDALCEFLAFLLDWVRYAAAGRHGNLAALLFTPVGHLLDQHGKLLAVLALRGAVFYVAALWYVERLLRFVAPQ